MPLLYPTSRRPSGAQLKQALAGLGAKYQGSVTISLLSKCSSKREKMSSAQEVKIFWRFITSSINRLVVCLDGLSESELNWKPLPNGNSLYVLVTHTLANTEENILGVLCGQPVTRHREDEFRASGGSSELIQKKWSELRERIGEGLEDLSPNSLNEEREHPRRGIVKGREILIVVARHTAEHLGQAELTRDLMLSKQD